MFIIEPSERTISEHFTEMENGYLKKWNKLKDKQISFDEVVDLFYQDNKTPKWVDSSIYYSTPDLTIIHLLFSRQFKEETEIYYLDRGTGPFKALVGVPPENRKVMKGDKFDVNWKWNWDNEKQLDIKSKLKTYQIIIPLLIGLISFFLFGAFGWSAFSTITERSGLNGSLFNYYNLSRTTFTIYTGLVSLSGLYFILTMTVHLIKSDQIKLTKTFWHFLIFATILVVCELYLQTRFIGKG